MGRSGRQNRPAQATAPPVSQGVFQEVGAAHVCGGQDAR